MPSVEHVTCLPDCSSVDAPMVLDQLRAQSRLDNPALPPALRRNLAAFCDAVGDLLARASDVHASANAPAGLVLAAARCGVVGASAPAQSHADMLIDLVRQIEVEAHRGPSHFFRVRALAIQAADMTRPTAESRPTQILSQP